MYVEKKGGDGFRIKERRKINLTVIGARGKDRTKRTWGKNGGWKKR